MNTDSDLNLDALLQQAEQAAAIGDYATAASLYEQILEQNSDFRAGYWQLGLMYLLQEQEEEAQFTWMLPFTNAELELDAETEAQWTTELITTLQTAAQIQSDRQQWQQAWIIRQHIRQISPTDLENLLHLLQLDLIIREFQIEDLDEYGLVSQLQQQSVVPVDRLLTTLQQMLEKIPEHPVTFEFATACVPYFSDQETWIDRFLEVMRNHQAVAFQYGELCLQINPNHPHALATLSRFYQDGGEYEKGLELAERQFQLFDQLPEKILSAALLVRANLMMSGRWSAAEAALDQLTELLESWLANPGIEADTLLSPLLLCSPMFLYSYFSDDPQQTRSLQNRLAKLYTDNVQAFTAKHIPTYRSYADRSDRNALRDDRSKLRIGYLCRWFRRHSVGWLSRWVFEHCDRDRFEVYAYFLLEDSLTPFGKRWFADNATQYRFCGSEAFEIAHQIQVDGIDILIDLDSLTLDTTCNVMALKPAPIQATWLGLDASGIPTIDYFIADPYVLPDQAQNYYVEKIWRLPQTYLAVDGFEVAVPTLRRDALDIPDDAIVYFSSQTGQKRNPNNIRQQLKIIRSVPNSYFLIKGLGSETAKQTLFYQLAQEEGVSIDRLRFLPMTLNEETHRANLNIADIVLDTFPYNGATTTMETLWMGIPLVTRVGEQFAARNSYSMMMNAGIMEGIAWSDQEYIDWGIRLGTDPALRQEISWRLRQSRQTAPLWNAKQFTCQLEQAYEQMWQRYLMQSIQL